MKLPFTTNARLPASTCIPVFALCVVIVAPTLADSTASDHSSPIGRRVDDFTLDNCYGKPVTLSEASDGKLTVLVFLGTECPLAKLYGPRLSELQDRFQNDVTFVGINSNTQDSMTELAAYAHRFKINFPLLKDVGNQIADDLNAQRTPEVFVLDRDRVVRYHGRIDDQYGIGYSRDKSKRPLVATAIEELIRGREVTTSETEIVGCFIGRARSVEPRGDVTYSTHIAAIFNERCVSCHREGEIAPFTLSSYDDVVGWEDTILEVIEDGRMPPWFADPNHGSFVNDARLTEGEKELIATWIDNGMPEGDPADLPEPPVFTDGWRIPEPDEIIRMADQPFQVPAEGIVDYQHFVIDPGWESDRYVYAAEARPQNTAVVHHILVYIIPPGQREADLEKVLVGYAPGSSPVLLDEGMAIHVPAKSKLLFQMHYTPNGYQQTDLSYAGFCFVDESEVRKRLDGRIAVNPRFRIPANEPNHEVIAHYFAQRDENLISMTPHMHLRGKSFKFEARYPDGRQEVLLDVPKYDFNWQIKYTLQEPKRLPKGTVIECTAVFDNSVDNLSNPDPSRVVTWGDQSFDEMMIGFFDTVAAN